MLEMEFLKDKRPKKVALKPEFIKKQTDFIARIHDMGAEVLGSVHFGPYCALGEL